jgi:hypothetical protein
MDLEPSTTSVSMEDKIKELRETEGNIFRQIVSYRERANLLIDADNAATVTSKVDLIDRLETLMKLEDHLLWAWKRLDIDLKKGDPSLLIQAEQRALAQMSFLVTEHTVSTFHT